MAEECAVAGECVEAACRGRPTHDRPAVRRHEVPLSAVRARRLEAQVARPGHLRPRESIVAAGLARQVCRDKRVGRAAPGRFSSRVRDQAHVSAIARLAELTGRPRIALETDRLVALIERHATWPAARPYPDWQPEPAVLPGRDSAATYVVN